MYVCMYVYIYKYIYTHIHTYIHTYIHICVYIHWQLVSAIGCTQTVARTDLEYANMVIALGTKPNSLTKAKE